MITTKKFLCYNSDLLIIITSLCIFYLTISRNLKCSNTGLFYNIMEFSGCQGAIYFGSTPIIVMD